MNREDIKIYMLCRYYIYKAFYIVFSAPLSAKSVKELLDEKIKQSFAISEQIYNISELYKFLSKLLSEVSDKFLSRLNSEYTAMLIGPQRLPAPPWESAYESEEKILFGNSTLIVRNKYAKYGLLPTKHPHEADDHIAFELNFMLYLAGIINQDERSYKDAINDSLEFLDEHLLTWVGKFSSDLEYQNGLYIKKVSYFLTTFLKYDKTFLEIAKDGR